MSTNEAHPIRIIIVDDHPVVRAGLKLIVNSQSGLQIVGEAEDRAGALELAGREKPDIILLDLDLGEDNGLELMPELQRLAESARVVILTGLNDPEMHRRAVRLGAMGVVLKESANQSILAAIRSVSEGEIYLDRTLMSSLMDEG